MERTHACQLEEGGFGILLPNLLTSKNNSMKKQLKASGTRKYLRVTPVFGRRQFEGDKLLLREFPDKIRAIEGTIRSGVMIFLGSKKYLDGFTNL